MTPVAVRLIWIAASSFFVSAGCTPADDYSATHENSSRMQRHTLRHDGAEREFFVHVPSGNREGLPVVLAIHGYTSTASGFQAKNGLNRHADMHGYITVIPQGSHFWHEPRSGPRYLVTSWNDLAANLPPTPEGPHCTADANRYPCPPDCESCLRCGWTSCTDDLGFIDRMLDLVHAEYPTDPSRTYLLGVSNGAMMTLRLGCNLSDRFAAVAPIIGQLAPGHACGPTSDLPMIHLFGGQDDTVRFDGGPAGDGFMYTTAAQTAQVWAAAMDCDDAPQHWSTATADAAGLQCTAYANCRRAGDQVVSCLDPDGAHQWPEQYVGGVPATCVTPEQSESIPGQAPCPAETGAFVHLGMDLIWDFFKRYERAAE
ncbi:MAG: hypothetical protein KJO31_01375 [Gammaproteobacteria bacterium]|nr:hypothetical protein [Gammaproteobacteria bacterium]